MNLAKSCLVSGHEIWESDSQFAEFRSDTHIPSSGRRFYIHNIMATLNERLSSPNLYLRPVGWIGDQGYA